VYVGIDVSVGEGIIVAVSVGGTGVCVIVDEGVPVTKATGTSTLPEQPATSTNTSKHLERDFNMMVHYIHRILMSPREKSEPIMY
jgi:hypothetical protein